MEIWQGLVSHVINSMSIVQKTYTELSEKLNDLQYQFSLWFRSQSRAKRMAYIIAAITMSLWAVLMVIYRNTILEKFVELAATIENSSSGKTILWLLVFFVSFPPLIGFATLCTLTGMVYGLTFNGWFSLASGSILGSTAAFILFKYLLSDKARLLAEKSKAFSAVAAVVGQDDSKLLVLCLIRLCPLPYSLTNGGLASVPELSVTYFFLASLLTSPKLLINIYVGYKLKDLGETKSTTTKIIDFLSILLAGIASSTTAWLVYYKTKQRLEQFSIGLPNPDDEIYDRLLDDESLEV